MGENEFFLESLLVEGSLATEAPSHIAMVALKAARGEGNEVAVQSVQRLLRSGLQAVQTKYSDAAHLCVASLWIVCWINR